MESGIITPSAAEADPAVTLTSVIQRQLRHDIITGEIKPNAKLNIRRLCERFGSALSPVREALNRLAPEGLVRQIDNRGFVVAPVSIAEMTDLTMARCWMNETALRDAIAHGDHAWEEALVVALHRLTRTPRGENDEEQQARWSAIHRDFHATLIGACRSQHLLRFCDDLFLKAERYRHIARRSGERRFDKDGHPALAEAAIARDTDRAVALLNKHFNRTAEVVEHILGGRT